VVGRQVAIAIGVGLVEGNDGPSPLPLLSGARSGAEHFATWAQGQGFEVLSFIDTDSRSVALEDIRQGLEPAVRSGSLERLFVYFAGHGLGGFGDDVWLLSGAIRRRDEAIDVLTTRLDAKRSGIPHLAFFGDACRSGDDNLSDIVRKGRSIFPWGNVVGVLHDIDQFYATASGDRAWEFQPGDAVDTSSGIWSDCLMRALEGKESDAARKVNDGQATHAVLARSLKKYLHAAVPRESSIRVQKAQYPDSSAESTWKPNVISWIGVPAWNLTAPPSPPKLPRPKGPAGPTGPARALEAALAPGYALDDRQIQEETALNTSAHVRAYDASKTLIAQGSELLDVSLGHIERGSPGRDALGFSAVVELNSWAHLSSPKWSATAEFPGYRTVLRTSERGVEHVAFLAVADHNVVADPEMSDLLAGIGTVGLLWRLDIDGYLRRLLDEDLNPTIALYVAYTLERQGREEEISKIVFQFLNRDRAVPFDVALLAGEAAFKDAAASRMVVPGYPLISRGWQFLERLSHKDSSATFIRSQLNVTPWTTLREAGKSLVEALALGQASDWANEQWGRIHAERVRQNDARASSDEDAEDDEGVSVEIIGAKPMVNTLEKEQPKSYTVGEG
jgi:hypothetical protein